MFGYIKPYVPALTVGEYEAYKAAYCGLCRTMGSVTGQLSRFTLSYDFAFLAIFRMAVKRLPADFEKKGCAAHPLGNRLFMKRNGELAFCASACAVLTKGKIDDNIKDEKGIKRAAYMCASPFGTCLERRAGRDYGALRESVRLRLSELSALEEEKCPSADTAAAPFAALLADIFSFGLGEREKKIAQVLGGSVGKYIYIIDAADDISDDIKHEKYNPIAFMYENPVEYNSEKKKNTLKGEIAGEIYTALGLEINRAAEALDYMDFDGMATYKGILTNILTLGMRAEARRVLFGAGENENPMKHQI